MHCSGLNSDLKHLLNHMFREEGANLLKMKKLTNKWKLSKMVKNTQSNLIAKVKMLNIGVITKYTINQRWSRGHKARGQGQGQRHKKNPRPKPTTAFPRTDAFEAKDRNARGQGQGPRTQAQVLSKKKKIVFTKIFQAISKKTFSNKFFKRSTKF